jgi:ADP-ribosylglycohydrolase
MKRALESLEGLACGDAFGERFFLPPDVAVPMISQRATPAPPWFFTDDTMMAISIVSTLEKHAEINSDFLARDFAHRYDSSRGYGPAMHKLLAEIRHGGDWKIEAQALFGGQGSFGNGSAMRVAPLGTSPTTLIRFQNKRPDRQLLRIAMGRPLQGRRLSR